jgi:hypothetical protein
MPDRARLLQHPSAPVQFDHEPLDTCTACGVITTLHYDSSGQFFVGCYHAIVRAAHGVKQQAPERELAAREHAILAGATLLADLLHGDDACDADALALSPREMRAVVRMELAMRTVYQQGMVNGLPPVSGCWRAAIDRVLER